MKTLTFALILTLSLVFITNAYRLRANKALREQLLDYFLDAERQDLVRRPHTGLRKHLPRDEENFFNDDESNDTDDSKRRDVRDKFVGLGDDPFK